MKRNLMAASAATVFLAASGWAQQAEHEKHHPGGQAAQVAPAPGAMGPGMMSQGMMGRGMMGPGMMGRGAGPGAMLEGLSLAEEQHSKVQKIHDEMRQKHWDLMGRMMQERNQMRDAFGASGTDRAAADKAFKRMSELREQMFAARLDALAQIEGVLTPEQRAKLRLHMRRGGWMTMMH